MGAKGIPFTDDLQKTILELIRQGFTDTEICKRIKVCPDTFYGWKKRFPEFSEDTYRVRHMPDFTVEQKLYKRAKGFKYDETTKERSKSGKMVVTKVVTKLVVPDVTAQRFWLTNKKRREWQERQEIDNNITADIGGLDATILNILKAAKKDNR
jgi:hypothetical protein